MTTATVFASGEQLSSSTMDVEVSCGTFGTWSGNKSVKVTVELRKSDGTVLSTANSTFTSLSNSESAYKSAIKVAKPTDPSQIAYLRVIFSDFTTGTTLRVKYVRLTYKTAEPADPSKVATPTFTPEAGKFIGAQSVTIECETEGATIYYTTDGTDPTTSSATAQPIAVSATTTIKAIAAKQGLTNSDVASATYTIYTVDHAGTADDPYSVADARTAIEVGVGLTNVYAKGIVSVGTIGSINNNGQLTYDLSADGLAASDQLRVYNGKYINSASFTNSNKVREGDEVIVKGTLTKFNDLYEFTANNQLYSLVARTPILDIEDVENLSTEDDDLAVSDLTIDKDGSEGAITLVSGDETKATIVDNKIHPVAAGDVTITANIAAAGIYRAASATFNVHVIEICHNVVTLSKGTPEHGTFTLSRAAGEYPTCEGEVTVVVTPTPAEHYHVKAIVAPSSASISEPDGDGKYTVTYAKDTKAASEINVTFEEDSKSTVTWSVNGDTDLTTEVYDGEKPEFPATPSAFDATSTAFYGWATAAWSGKAANLNEKTVYTKAADMPEVDGAVTYYAVFAKADASAEPASFTSTFTSKAWADANSLWTSGDDGSQLQNNRGVQVTTGVSGANATTKSSYNDVDSVVVTYSTNASSGAGSIAIEVGGTAYTGDASVTKDGGTSDRSIKYTGASKATGAVKITVTCTTNSIYVKSVKVAYSKVNYSYSEFMTTKSSTPTAIDNAEVEAQAVKFIQNGQIFIEKNGVVYNVMGQEVR
ncbi:MAG: chitobiase/beta-hexosaminidase C-terminal domain-containing protein [Paludibacteraceae bacterium]|nr:chitobiase/beta-hexosaminidase C-terminal domain-containing protein [Paludibacteraceae bacterium]